LEEGSLTKYMQKKSKIKIALVGNPNTGKSTFFNTLTGSKQHIGNWPGKTVEKKEGEIKYKDFDIQIIDLPGSYSLSSYTEEETVTSDFILNQEFDCVIQVVDMQNLERNLFMTVQLIELGVPLILALNMRDLAEKNGIDVDNKMLVELLGVPAMKIIAKNKKTLFSILDEVIKRNNKSQNINNCLKYDKRLGTELNKIKNYLQEKETFTKQKLNYFAIRLLSDNKFFKDKFSTKKYFLDLSKLVEKSVSTLTESFNQDINTILANIRYGFIKGLGKKILKYNKEERKKNISNTLDNILTNRYLALPFLLFIIYLIFKATFELSAPLMGLIESFIAFVANNVLNLLSYLDFSPYLKSLIIDGVLGGVGNILVFIPVIGILFFLLAVLEDSGYMARIAYVMDKLMSKLGLHGKAFIPLILGFGCNVPAVMATRTLESKKDRLLTILISPFISCGARLPVYVLFTTVFFIDNHSLVVFSLYIIGIVVAILLGLLFKKVLFKNYFSPFVIELPPYRLPSLKVLLVHTWDKVWLFIKKAGTLILFFSVILWALASLPFGVEYGSKESFIGQIGIFLSPILKPLGFANWRVAIALFFGIVAKELVISSLGTLYGVPDVESLVGESSLMQFIQNDFTALKAYSFMVFVLLYVPCFAFLATVKKETNSWKWPIFILFYTSIVAYLVSFVIYQGGLLLGFS